jgi:hypothetical protein
MGSRGSVHWQDGWRMWASKAVSIGRMDEEFGLQRQCPLARWVENLGSSGTMDEECGLQRQSPLAGWMDNVGSRSSVHWHDGWRIWALVAQWMENTDSRDSLHWQDGWTMWAPEAVSSGTMGGEFELSWHNGWRMWTPETIWTWQRANGCCFHGENYAKHANTLCGQNAEFLSVKGDGDRLCGVVVRVPSHRSRGPGFDPQHYQIV